MKVSIFTATHDSKYLREVYDSINGQTFDEWVIVYNNGAKPIGFNNPRVKEITIDLPNVKGVGAYKKLACANCTGDILVELDHDDLLTQDAISEIRKAFEDLEVGFVYSNDLYANMDWTKTQRYNPAYGWQYRETEYKGHLLDEAITFEATPASVSKIWFAPDHVRAFRKSIYNKVGGHNPELDVLDDQDLMCRMYLETKFYHIDKALYVYRVHTDNTWLTNNKKIQDGVWPLYDKYIEKMTLKWASNNGILGGCDSRISIGAQCSNHKGMQECSDKCSGELLKLDLGGRLFKQEGYKSVDLKDADINCDLNETWPFPDNSVGVIRSFDVFEHLKDPLHTMKELYRVLAPGGYAFIQVPSTDGRGAFQDPTHVSFWNENSFLYYTNREWAKYIDTPVRFQAMRIYTTEKNEQQVCWTIAHLVKLENGMKIPGIIEI